MTELSSRGGSPEKGVGKISDWRILPAASSMCSNAVTTTGAKTSGDGFGSNVPPMGVPEPGQVMMMSPVDPGGAGLKDELVVMDGMSFGVKGGKGSVVISGTPSSPVVAMGVPTGIQ